jgi:hypothetical protein
MSERVSVKILTRVFGDLEDHSLGLRLDTIAGRGSNLMTRQGEPFSAREPVFERRVCIVQVVILDGVRYIQRARLTFSGPFGPAC